MSKQFQPPEGTYLYVLGLVIIATQTDRFWLGIALSSVPIVIGIVAKTTIGGRWVRP